MSERTERQTWNAEGYSKNVRFVSTYGTALFDLLPGNRKSRILDLGCGDGALTIKLQNLGFDVVGIDASDNFIEASQALGLDARLMNAEKLTFNDEFDCVFSNAAMHWMLDPEAVISGVRRALKPKGTFVAEMGGYGNVAAVATAITAALEIVANMDGKPLHPWFFPSIPQYSALLENQGFKVDYIELIPRPTPLPTGLKGWLEIFAGPFVADLDDEKKKQVLEKVEDLLVPALRDSDGNWIADYVRLRFKATKR